MRQRNAVVGFLCNCIGLFPIEEQRCRRRVDKLAANANRLTLSSSYLRKRELIAQINQTEEEIFISSEIRVDYNMLGEKKSSSNHPFGCERAALRANSIKFSGYSFAKVATSKQMKLILASLALIMAIASLVECIKRTQYHEQVSLVWSSMRSQHGVSDRMSGVCCCARVGEQAAGELATQNQLRSDFSSDPNLSNHHDRLDDNCALMIHENRHET